MVIWLLSGLLLTGSDPVDFDREVLPILQDLCFGCHGPDEAARKADLRLDVREDVLFVTEPGDPDESELIVRLLDENPKQRMPPAESGKVATAEQIDVLRRWVQEGVAWKTHWAFDAIDPLAAPATTDRGWCRDELDGHVLDHLRSEDLAPASAADPSTWLRRVTFDLTGLPPTIDEFDAFIRGLTSADSADEVHAAEAAVVDRLLASRRHAEHRTREWLDIARYADTNGYQNDFRRDQWPWRDWVLRAFEANMPYDRFVLEQVAGDLLPDASNASILGTGFQRNHRTVTEGGSIDEEWRVENVADRTETTSTAFLGLTLACARCHDHKFDPLTQRDYYSFYAFFDQVDEKGVYNEVRGNVAPLLRVPTEEQTARLADLSTRIEEYDSVVNGLLLRAAERHAAWRVRGRTGPRAETGAPLIVFRGAGWDDGPLIELSGVPEEHVDLGPSVSFEQDRPFSVSLWVRPETSGAIYSRMDDTDRYRGTDLILLSDMRPAVHLIHEWTKNAIKVVGTEPLAAGRWHHVAVTYDGSRKAAGVTLYIDGRAMEVTVEVDALDGTIATDEPFRLGLRRYAGNLKGTLLDVRVDGHVLTREAVLELARERARLETGVSFFLACFDEVSVEARQQLATARAEADRIERDEVPTAMVLRDRAEPRETHVLSRGRYDQPIGAVLQPDVPAIFGGLAPDAERSRLGLARWLVDPANPLTARVAVNRVWASFFGRGLVTTPEDFGVRGDRPEYPELLDRLAADLVENSWDLAALERRIALSATYRQSSDATAEQRERDPDNRLLARGPRHRLDAESLRDQALLVSGLLAERWGGPSVKPYQPAGLWKELAGGAGQGDYVPAEGDDLFRRSVYTYRKRTVPHPTLTTFDAPGFELCTVRRSTTNTPLQALALLNGPTYLEAARHLARRMMDASEDEDERLVAGVRIALTRTPLPAELDVLRAALTRQIEDFGSDPVATAALLGIGATAPPPDERTPEWAAYTMLASTLLNLDEAVTKR